MAIPNADVDGFFEDGEREPKANGAHPYAAYKADEPGPTFKIWTPDEIWAPLPAPDYLVDGLTVRGSLAMIVAYGASLKTWVLEDGALSVAMGAPWLQRFATKQGRSLLVDFESGSYELRRRAHRIARGREFPIPIPGFAFTSMPALSLADPAFYEAIAPLAKTYQFIGIDSLAAGSGGIDENDARFARSLNGLKAIAEHTGCVIVVLHHARKGKGEDSDPREMVRGTSAIFNACDVVLQLMRGKNAGAFVMRQTKARGGKSVDPFVVHVEDTAEDASIVKASNAPDIDGDDEGVERRAIEKARKQITVLLGDQRDLRTKDEIYNRIGGSKPDKIKALKELLAEERKLVVLHKGAYRLASEVGQ